MGLLSIGLTLFQKTNSKALQSERVYKQNFGYEPYLDIISRDMRIYFTRLRFSTLNLRIETCRYSNPPVPRSERLCSCCNATGIEDSYHLLILCPLYIEIRQNFFPFCLHIFKIAHLCLNLLNC